VNTPANVISHSSTVIGCAPMMRAYDEPATLVVDYTHAEPQGTLIVDRRDFLPASAVAGYLRIGMSM
ncbi:MAG: hypothetical protein ACRD3S_14065, partial [Terracidiphilus sp.]